VNIRHRSRGRGKGHDRAQLHLNNCARKNQEQHVVPKLNHAIANANASNHKLLML
jgi:hypothetical protein